ncbi:hypothetical protein VFPBJ_11227 [Purpureocillium lilacinum]|uniref:Uncharacterized protein n=1 Tax=Purpureocillium lilacinum TaxID=33203 RepID=A0A179FG49_PURLI|nr:hypothetical protein VFPBJ_11227 [Purpureocillium lilacinum]
MSTEAYQDDVCLRVCERPKSIIVFLTSSVPECKLPRLAVNPKILRHALHFGAVVQEIRSAEGCKSVVNVKAGPKDQESTYIHCVIYVLVPSSGVT